MSELSEAVELAGPPSRWFIVLHSGDTLEFLTHGYSIEDGCYVFSLLFRGTPNFELTSLKIPEHLVANVHD